MGQHNTPIGELLKQEGLVTEAHLHAAIAIQRSQGGRLGEILIGLGPVTEEQVHRILAKQHGVRFWEEEELFVAPIPDALLTVFSVKQLRQSTGAPITECKVSAENARRKATLPTLHLVKGALTTVMEEHSLEAGL